MVEDKGAMILSTVGNHSPDNKMSPPITPEPLHFGGFYKMSFNNKQK